MNYKIEERIENILTSDKIGDPQHVCKVLEEELKPIITSYIVLSSEVKVRFKKEDNRNIFFIEFCAERIKPFGYKI